MTDGLHGRCMRTLAAGSVALALLLVFAGPALALFKSAVVGGPSTIATSTLAAPGKASASQYLCRTGKVSEVEVGWSATSSTYATSYEVERATVAAGPYTAVASVAIGKSSYIDAGPLAYSTTYYYRVSSVFRSWSTANAYTSVKTLNKSCA